MSDKDIEDVDLVVVGGGKAGKSLALDRAQAGWSVVMVERDKVGGTCINVACIPTKSLVGSARTLLTCRHAATMGVRVDDTPAIDLELLRAHKEGVVGGMVEAHAKLFSDSEMDFVLGTARFVGERTVQITPQDGGTRLVRGRDVLINTGTTPAASNVPGAVEAEAWDSESILRLKRLPASLTVLGGGYVGCEFASMFAAFGSQVTLLHGRNQLLPREDPDVAAEVADGLRNLSVEVRLGVRATAVRREPNHGDVVTSLDDDSEVRGQELLIATGRVPVTADLGLEAAGVQLTDRGFVAVDEHLRTTADHVWQPAMSPAARSSPTPHGTTFGSSGPTSLVGTP